MKACSLKTKIFPLECSVISLNAAIFPERNNETPQAKDVDVMTHKPPPTGKNRYKKGLHQKSPALSSAPGTSDTLVSDVPSPHVDESGSKLSWSTDVMVKINKHNDHDCNPHSTGLIFESATYKNVSLPKWLREFEYEDIYPLLISISNSKPMATTRKAMDEYVEMQRQCNYIRENIRSETCINEMVRDFLVLLYAQFPQINIRPDVSYKTPKHHVFVDDARIKLPLLVNTNKKVAHKLGTETNFIYDLIELADVKGRQLNPRKLKAILRSQMYVNNDIKEIKSLLTRKMPLWDAKRKYLEDDLKQFSWFVPYIPPEFLYYEVINVKTFKQMFQNVISNLRAHILSFAEQFVEIGRLNATDFKKIMRSRSDIVKAHLQAPQAQLMFTQKMDRKLVKELVYRKAINSLDQKIKKSESLVSQRTLRKVTKSKTRGKLRDEKFDFDHSFETQANTTTNKTTFEVMVTTVVQIICHLVVFLCSFLVSFYSVLYFEEYVVNVANMWTAMCNSITRFYTELLDTIKNAVNTYRLAHATLSTVDVSIKTIQDDIKTSMHFLTTPDTTLPPHIKLKALEIKTLLHTFYHLYNGNNMEATSWATNFVFTRPEILKDFVIAMADRTRTFTFGNSTVDMLVGGRNINVHAEDVQSIFSEADEGDIDVHTLADNYDTGVMETQDSGYSEILQLFGTMLAKTQMSNMTPDDIRQANNQFTFINAAQRTYTTHIESITKIVSVMSRTFFAFDPFDLEYRKFMIEILDVISFTHDTMNVQNMENDRVLLDNIRDMNERAQKLVLHPRLATVPSFVVNQLTRRVVQLEKLNREATLILEGMADRVQPVFVVFTGPPKVGKSAATEFIMKGLTFLEGETDKAGPAYRFNQDTEYWEGYTQQTHVVMDDLFRTTDEAIRRHEASSIIGMINVSQFLLNKAFETKGKSYFDSKYVFASTNDANNGIANWRFRCGMTDVNAIKRRMHLVLHRDQVIDEDVRTNKFRVDQCNVPGLDIVGKSYTTEQLVPLIYACRETFKRQQQAHVYNTDLMEDLYGNLKDGQLTFEDVLNDANNTPVEEPDDQFVPESDNTDISPDNFLVRMVQLGMYSWWESEHRNYHIALFFLLCGMLTVGSAIYSYFPEDNLSPDSKEKKMPTGKTKLKKNSSRVLKSVTKLAKGKNNFRPQCSPGCEASIQTTLTKSVFLVGAAAYDSSNIQISSSTAVCFHIRNNIYCVPAHFYLEFFQLDNVKFFLKKDREVELYDFPLDAVQVGDDDMVLFRLPRKVLPHALYKHFQSVKTEFDLHTGCPLNLLSVETNGTPNVKPQIRASYTGSAKYTLCERTFIIKEAIAYRRETVAGDSGSPVVIEDNDGRAKVIGMHVGIRKTSENKLGCALFICKEEIDEYIAKTGWENQEFVPESDRFCEGLEIDYHVSPDKQSRLATKSKIKQSPLFGWNGAPTKIPAHLTEFTNSQGETIDPVQVAQRKLSQVPTPETTISDQTENFMRNIYPRSVDPVGVVSIDEALNGDSLKGSTAINMSTSAGYPFTFTAKKGKTPHLIRDKLDKISMSVDLEMCVDNGLCDLREGRNISVLYADALKDETRPVAKVAQGKTRLFSTCPLDYLIICRMYFLDFVTYIQRTASSKPIAVGINPHSMDWHQLRLRLGREEGSLVAGDFENYDGNLPAFVLKRVCGFINWWYDDGPVHARVRELLFVHVYNATHILRDCVYTLARGLPSGHGCTSIFNSIANCYMTHTVLSEDLGVMDDEMDFTVYGDDNVIWVKKDCVRVSDLSPHYIRRFGMKYTHFSKADVDPLDTIYTVKFLGRAFVDYLSKTLAPLDIVTVVESTYWNKDKAKEMQILLATIDTFFIELVHHGPDVFEEMSYKLFKVLQDRVPILVDAARERKLSYSHYFRSMYCDDVKRDFSKLAFT